MGLTEPVSDDLFDGLEREELQGELDTRSCDPLALFQIGVDDDVVNAYYLLVVQPTTGHVELGPPSVSCFLKEPVIRRGEAIDVLDAPRDEGPCWRTGRVTSITRLRRRDS